MRGEKEKGKDKKGEREREGKKTKYKKKNKKLNKRNKRKYVHTSPARPQTPNPSLLDRPPTPPPPSPAFSNPSSIVNQRCGVTIGEGLGKTGRGERRVPSRYLWSHMYIGVWQGRLAVCRRGDYGPPGQRDRQRKDSPWRWSGESGRAWTGCRYFGGEASAGQKGRKRKDSPWRWSADRGTKRDKYNPMYIGVWQGQRAVCRRGGLRSPRGHRGQQRKNSPEVEVVRRERQELGRLAIFRRGGRGGEGPPRGKRSRKRKDSPWRWSGDRGTKGVSAILCT